MGKETLQWWIQGRGPGARLPPPPPPLFLDQNDARRAEKKNFFQTGPRPYLRFWMTRPTPHPPYLKVWIRQCLEQTEKKLGSATTIGL